MDTNVLQAFYSGIIEFIAAVNWLYIIAFMLTAWLINDHADATNRANWLTWWSRVGRTFRSFIIGIILILLFCWGFNFRTREEIINMIFSLLLAMVIYKFGIDKVFAALSKKIGLKIDE